MFLAQAETAMEIVTKASTATDRWLFLAALAIIIIGGSMVIRWLVASLANKDAAHTMEMQDMRKSHIVERAEWRVVLDASKQQFIDAIATQRKDFRDELASERHACAQERTLDRDARHATANAINSVSLALQVLAHENPLMQEATDKIIRDMHKKTNL